jgi:hypothetical protein
MISLNHAVAVCKKNEGIHQCRFFATDLDDNSYQCLKLENIVKDFIDKETMSHLNHFGKDVILPVGDHCFGYHKFS